MSVSYHDDDNNNNNSDNTLHSSAFSQLAHQYDGPKVQSLGFNAGIVCGFVKWSTGSLSHTPIL